MKDRERMYIQRGKNETVVKKKLINQQKIDSKHAFSVGPDIGVRTQLFVMGLSSADRNTIYAVSRFVTLGRYIAKKE